jgi:hypothetical protein
MRIFLVFLVAACISGGSVWAQEGTADEDYVLQRARDKHSSLSRGTAFDGSDDSGTPEQVYGYFPFVISFVPGVSYPFGTWDTSLSLAPIGAITGSIHGLQGAGVFNLADGDVAGLQGAGVFNMASGEVRGLQNAGVFNMARRANAIQAAGVFNMANSVTGVQAAGVFNIAGSMHGIQAAGVFNVAGDAHGAMIGLVNVAENLDGVAIGLVNVIGNGIHEISVDYQFDGGMGYASYRSGTPFLYLTLYAGQVAANVGRSAEGASLGAGLGHRFRASLFTADIELCAETPLDADSLVALGQALRDGEPPSIGLLTPFNRSFGSVRATLGLGRRKGLHPYVGVKADLELAGTEVVPQALRTSFGTAEPYSVTIFDLDLVIWPKLFVGIGF